MDKFNLLRSILGKGSKAKMTRPYTDASRRKVVAIAPDKFKGTLSAEEVTSIIAQGILQNIDCEVRCYPMADGGEGSSAILARDMNLEQVSIAACDAMGRPLQVHYFSDGSTATVDSSAVVGLSQLSDVRPDPWHASSFGLGLLINRLLETGIRNTYIGIGGTAMCDGGAGMLQALGAVFTDVAGKVLSSPISPALLPYVFKVDLTNVRRSLLRDYITVLSDVDVPLLPDLSAESFNLSHCADKDSLSALSFAEQKGFCHSDLPTLARCLQNLVNTVDATMLPPATPPRFAGAGGGLGYAFGRVLKAKISSGADYLINSYGIFLSDPLPDVIITGEGCFDRQSLGGKVVGSIVNRTESLNIPTIIVAGKMADGLTHKNVIQTASNLPPSSPLNHDSALSALTNSMPQIVSAVRNALRIAK